MADSHGIAPAGAAMDGNGESGFSSTSWGSLQTLFLITKPLGTTTAALALNSAPGHPMEPAGAWLAALPHGQWIHDHLNGVQGDHRGVAGSTISCQMHFFFLPQSQTFLGTWNITGFCQDIHGKF